MTKFQVSYKLALAVLVLPTLVFFYLVGMSAFNGTGFLSAEEDSFVTTETEIVTAPSCGKKDISEKTSDYDDSYVSIDFTSGGNAISVSGKNGWSVVKVWLDVEDDNKIGFFLYATGPLNNFNPNPGKDIEKVKVELYKECPTPTPTATLVPTVTPTLEPTATPSLEPTVTVTPTEKPGQEVCPETGDGWTKYDNWADEKTEQSHDAGVGYVVTEVCVKGSTDIYYFKADGEMYCWKVEGIGKQIAKVSETWTDVSAAAVVKCHDISHASFKVELVPTATPTETPVVTPTETPVVTPTATSTPTVTPTEGQILGIDATAVPTTTPVYQARVLAVTGNSMYAPVGVGMIIMGLAMILGTDSVLLKRK